MSLPKILDGFCKAGGAGFGLYLAGFDVVGVDIEPQKNYPAFHKADYAKHFEFRQMDFFDVDLSEFDAVWASPPCQPFGQAKMVTAEQNLIAAVRFQISLSGKPYIMENIQGAPLEKSALLCGSMFGLRTLRHRVFESNVQLSSPSHPDHKGQGAKDLSKYMTLDSFPYIIVTSGRCPKRDAEIAMGINWMTLKELTQAIPPVYSEYLGKQLIQVMQ